MAMKLNMSMKLSQSLRMTPQLQQAIKLLQLSRLELETEVRKELLENPVLEEIEDSVSDDPAMADSQLAEDVQTKEATKDEQDPTKQDEFDWDSYMESQNKPAQSMSAPNNDEIMNFENMVSETKSLTDHLMWQVGLSGFNEEEEAIMSLLVNYVDDDGYLKVDLAELAKEEEIELIELEEMIPFLHEFDPPGVGARNLQECLLIQAKHIQEDTHDLVEIVTNHIKDLEKKNYPGIAKAMGVDIEVVIDLCKIILSMDPKPGRAFIVPDTHYIMPDVYVYKVGEEYVVSLNEEGLPRLRVSNLYRNLMQAEKDKRKNPDGKSEEAHEYIQEKLRSALWLIKSIHQRQRTIYKVTESIVKHQGGFFEKGAEAIKPMILRDIAADIGMHESTVSRVTTNKYVHTPRGIFELKYFFNSGISKTNGDSVASESVKLKIRDLVDKEEAQAPLSDQKIVDLLKKDGIKIARRTVAKYRDVLKILPSSKRKKYF